MSVEAEPKFKLPPERLQLLAQRHGMTPADFLAAFQSRASIIKYALLSDMQEDQKRKTGPQAGRVAVAHSSWVEFAKPLPEDAPNISDDACLAAQFEAVAAVKERLEPDYIVEMLTLPPIDRSSTPDLSLVKGWGLMIEDRRPGVA